MKRFGFSVILLRWSLLCLAIFPCARAALAEEPLHAEALLVWGSNDPQSPDPKHVPVDASLARKLAGSNSPYKWKYYYEVPPRQPVNIAVGETKKGVHISDRCTLDVKNLGKNRVEVHLYGQGKPVLINTEPFDDRYLIYAGPSANETAWLVVLRKVKPRAANPAQPSATASNTPAVSH